MKIISGLNHIEKQKQLIQECVQHALEHPFEQYIYITEYPHAIEKLFFQYTHYLVNIEVLTWQDYLKKLQIQYHLTSHSVINNTELIYKLWKILKENSFRCFETSQPFPLINKFIPLIKELNLSSTYYHQLNLTNQPKLIDYVNLQQYLNGQMNDYTHLTLENIFDNIEFNQESTHIYIEADHLYQPLRQDIIQRLSKYHDLTILYTYHNDNRLLNAPYRPLCKNAVDKGKSYFLLENLFLQSPQSCLDDKQLYTFISPTIQQEVKRVVYTIYQKIVDENLRYQDFAIIYPDQTYQKLLIQSLEQLHIPHHLPIINECRYEPSYQFIIKMIDECETMSIQQFASFLHEQDIDSEYQCYFETLYPYTDIMTAQEFHEFFIATYPKTHQEKAKMQDHINIYSIEECQIIDKKHIFILGMNETVLPRFYKDTELLLNEDIEFLRKNNISTPLTTQEKLGIHHNDILKVLQSPYLSMTFSYSLSTLSGETLLPSSLYKQLQKMYQLKTLKNNTYLPIEDYYIKGGQIKEKQVINQNTHDYIQTKNQPVSLSQNTVQQLYSSSMSVSQIETYNKCPFLYFIQYGLGIYPLKENKLMPNELGSLIHYVLSICIQKNEDISQLVDNYISKNENLSKKILSSKQNQYFINQLKKDLIITLDILQQIMNDSLFKVHSQEEKIEDDIKDIHFKGFVDRIDTYENYVSIIDYKSSSKDIDLNLALQGFNIQMLLYLNMITKKYKKDPAAVLYFNTKKRILASKQTLKEEINPNDIQDLYRYGGYVVDDDNHHIIQSLDPKMDKKSHMLQITYVKSKEAYKGHVISPEQLNKLLEEIENHIYNLYQQMMNGTISITPKGSDQNATHTLVNPCRYCPYHSVCQFDVFYNDYNLVEFYNIEEKLGGKEDAI